MNRIHASLALATLALVTTSTPARSQQALDLFLKPGTLPATPITDVETFRQAMATIVGPNGSLNVTERLTFGVPRPEGDPPAQVYWDRETSLTGTATIRLGVTDIGVYGLGRRSHGQVEAAFATAKRDASAPAWTNRGKWQAEISFAKYIEILAQVAKITVDKAMSPTEGSLVLTFVAKMMDIGVTSYVTNGANAFIEAYESQYFSSSFRKGLTGEELDDWTPDDDVRAAWTITTDTRLLNQAARDAAEVLNKAARGEGTSAAADLVQPAPETVAALAPSSTYGGLFGLGAPAAPTGSHGSYAPAGLVATAPAPSSGPETELLRVLDAAAPFLSRAYQAPSDGRHDTLGDLN